MYYWLHKLKRLPSEYLAMTRTEKAFVIAAIQVKIKAEKEQEKEMAKKQKRPRKKG